MESIILTELINCLSEVVDLISDKVRDHHKQVAYASYHLAEAMEIQYDYKCDTVIAAALHDIGGLSLKDRISTTYGFEDSTSHAEMGYRLLSVFEPFKNIANIVKYHHTLWNYGNILYVNANTLPIGSQIVMLADRIAIWIDTNGNVLNQAENVIKKVKLNEGNVFNPVVVKAFEKVSQKDSFWLDITSHTMNELLTNKLKLDVVYTGSDIDGIINLLSGIIDFRSVFTATHSKGVAIVAETLSRLMSFSENDSRRMRIAGMLHDIGKLAVPTEILEKNGLLDRYERNIIRTHAYYTDSVLSQLSSFETVREWASLHHESSNGKGYPFGLNSDELSLGARIMKVSDVFVALMEDRPYRAGIGITKAIDIMNSMADNLELDPDIISILSANSGFISDIYLEDARKARIYYQEFIKDLHKKSVNLPV